MISELGGPTDGEMDFLILARACGHAGGLRVLSQEMRTLATRSAARGMAELYVDDNGVERARITSMGANYLNRMEPA